MGGSQKKAILRLRDGAWVPGYLPAGGFVRQDRVEFLDPGARQQALPLASLRWICFVRDFNSGEPANPERLLRTAFAGRPRLAGLWMRAILADGMTLEGIAPNDRSLLEPAGLLLTPPDARSNTQRIFLPHASIVDLAVVAVIGASRARRKPPASERQPELFPALPSTRTL